ncbi:ribonuclease H-like domain-containing protein [Tanacetum coccineum]
MLMITLSSQNLKITSLLQFWFMLMTLLSQETNCVDEIDKFKTFLKSKFKIKDLRHLKYFLGIEVIRSDKDLCMSQRKYCLELLKEYGLLECKPVSTPMERNSVLLYVLTKDDPLLDNITREAEYRSLSSAACEIIWIQKLLLDLGIKVTLPVNLHCDNKSALQLAINPAFHERSKHFEIDCLKEASHSSVEAKYHGVVNVMAETHWLRNLLRELYSPLHLATIVYCDNTNLSILRSPAATVGAVSGLLAGV